MRVGDRGQETGGRPAAALAPVFALFVLAGLLLLPIFGHGCHRGTDIDTEPQAVRE